MDSTLVFATLGAVAVIALRSQWWITRVVSRSMFPTIMPGRLLLTRRLRTPPRRGDVITVELPTGRVIKRVIGLPGELVEVRHGHVRINQVPLDEPYVQRWGGGNTDWQVPAGAFIVLGDNRADSWDARKWTQPFVRAHQMRGRITSRVQRREP